MEMLEKDAPEGFKVKHYISIADLQVKEYLHLFDLWVQKMHHS